MNADDRQWDRHKTESETESDCEHTKQQNIAHLVFCIQAAGQPVMYEHHIVHSDKYYERITSCSYHARMCTYTKFEKQKQMGNVLLFWLRQEVMIKALDMNGSWTSSP